jgi:Na+-driven multidrug efflux pump
MCNELGKSFLISQGVSSPFLPMNLLNFASYAAMGYVFIWKMGYGMYGFVIMKSLLEIINLGLLLWIFKKYGHPETQKLDSLGDYFDFRTFAKYMPQYFLMGLGWYAGYFGIELLTIMIGSLQDVNFIAAWACAFNIYNICLVMGSGMANVARTDVGIKVGDYQLGMAKKYALMGLVLAHALSFVMGLLVMTFHIQLSSVFSELPEVLEYLEPLMFYNGFAVWFVVGITTFWTILRIINKNQVITIISFLFSVVFLDVASYIMLFHTSLPWAYTMLILALALAGNSLSMIVFLINYNWDKLEV